MSASITDVEAKIECGLCLFMTPESICDLACGLPGCNERACDDCLVIWYSANAPGKVLSPGCLKCAFCRRIPSTATYARLDLRPLPTNAAIAVTEAAEWAHAWCVACQSAQRYAKRTCADAAASAISKMTHWHCGDCQELVIKSCPGCGIRVEKSDGCDHMQCPVCHADWCFYCGQPFASSEEVYDHLDDVHGGQDNVAIVGEDHFDMAQMLGLFPQNPEHLARR